jgi:hypothetical protein
VLWDASYAEPTPDVRVAVLVVRCNPGAGTPPVAVYVYDHAASPTDPHLADTLVRDTDNWQAGVIKTHGATISLPVAGFSSINVPNCCPDVETTLTWAWDGTRYRLTSDVPRHITGGPGGYY